MKTRIITVLLAMALPLCAQDAPKDTAKHVFYEAFWLEKGARDYSGASELYTKFLTMAPKHKLARQAARLQFGLLNKTGQTKARDAFREKYKNLLGDAAAPEAPRGGDVRPGEQGENPRRRGEQGENPRGRGEQGENPRRRGEQGENPRGRGEQGENPRGRGTGTPEEMAARLAQIEKDLAKAKEAGDEEQVARLTRQLERMKRFAEGGGRTGAGGRTGRTQRTPQKPVTEMNEEELTQFKTRIERMASLIDRMSERMTEEEAKAAKASFAALKKALDEGKLEAAQKAYDKMREAFPRRGGRGGAGGEGRTGGGRGGAGGGRTGGGGGGGGGGGR